MIISDDIVFYNSGGLFNDNPSGSLGGMMSPASIASNKIRNIFPDSTSYDPANSHTDYRCVYVRNNNATDTFFNLNVSITDKFDDGSKITIGIPTANEVQNVRVVGIDTITSGIFSLKIGNEITSDIIWTTIEDVGEQIESAIETLSYNVAVSSSDNGTTATYSIEYHYSDRSKIQPILTVESFSFDEPLAYVIIDVITKGTPINDIATHVGFSNNPPNGISFVSATDTPIEVGDLLPFDSFFIWIKKVVPANPTSTALESYFTIHLSGQQES